MQLGAASAGTDCHFGFLQDLPEEESGSVRRNAGKSDKRQKSGEEEVLKCIRNQ